MTTITVHAAKTNLSKLLAQVEAGEEFIIARGDKPVAKLVPIEPNHAAGDGSGSRSSGTRGFGMLKCKLNLSDAFFFDPLPDDELACL